MNKENNNVLQNKPELQECEQSQPRPNETESNTQKKKSVPALRLLSSLALAFSPKPRNHYLDMIKGLKTVPIDPVLTAAQRHAAINGAWHSVAYKDAHAVCKCCGKDFYPRFTIKKEKEVCVETFVKFHKRTACSASCAASMRNTSRHSWSSVLHKTAKKTCKGCGVEYKPLTRTTLDGKVVAQMSKTAWLEREYCSRICNNNNNPERGNGSKSKYSVYQVLNLMQGKLDPLLNPVVRQVFKTEGLNYPYSQEYVVIPLCIQSCGVAVYFYRDKSRPSITGKLQKRASVIEKYFGLSPIFVNTGKFVHSHSFKLKRVSLGDLMSFSSLN
jgi:hypothetical protein